MPPGPAIRLPAGKDNFAADRESGDRLVAAHPGVKTSVLVNRAFLRRAVRFLAGEAGLRDPQAILNDVDLRATLDLDKPVGLLLLAVMHFITDERKPFDIVRRLLAALPSGSCLAMSHVTYDPLPEPVVAKLNAEQQRTGEQFQPRSRAEFEQFFTGLELAEPGITLVSDWRPDDESGPRPPDAFAALYAGVARVP
jgi:hypothetical protein